jgi:hypothetical protein
MVWLFLSRFSKFHDKITGRITQKITLGSRMFAIFILSFNIIHYYCWANLLPEGARGKGVVQNARLSQKRAAWLCFKPLRRLLRGGWAATMQYYLRKWIY